MECRVIGTESLNIKVCLKMMNLKIQKNLKNGTNLTSKAFVLYNLMFSFIINYL